MGTDPLPNRQRRLSQSTSEYALSVLSGVRFLQPSSAGKSLSCPRELWKVVHWRSYVDPFSVNVQLVGIRDSGAVDLFLGYASEQYVIKLDDTS